MMVRFDAGAQVIVSGTLTEDVHLLLKESESENVYLVVDSKVAGHSDVRGLVDFLDGSYKSGVLAVESAEPTTDMVNEYSGAVRGKGIDMFIGIGGGSVIDLTKALSVMAVNEGRVEDYHGTGKPFSTGIKKIMIPTTAGTGSEVTPGAVLLNAKTKFKRSIGGKFVAPDYALLYAPLTLAMPEEVAASTGMDALGHAIESYTAKSANDITRMYSKEAFRLVYNNLPKVLESPGDLSLREKVLLGSCLAGFAIYNSNTGACHSMSYALGIYNGVPHGVAVSLLLPKVVGINVEKGCTLYGGLYELVEGRKGVKDAKEASEEFCALLEKYGPLSRVGKKLTDYGVDEGNYAFLAERGLDLTPALSNNPVEFGLEDSKRALAELTGAPPQKPI